MLRRLCLFLLLAAPAPLLAQAPATLPAAVAEPGAANLAAAAAVVDLVLPPAARETMVEQMVGPMLEQMVGGMMQDPRLREAFDKKPGAQAVLERAIARQQTEADHFIYGLDSPVLMQHLAQHDRNPIAAQRWGFSATEHPDAAAWLENDLILVDMNKDPRRKRAAELQIATREQKLKGKHNQYNSMASAIVGRVLEIRNEVIRESLTDFEGLEHRL
jgi:hypothetical protein